MQSKCRGLSRPQVSQSHRWCQARARSAFPSGLFVNYFLNVIKTEQAFWTNTVQWKCKQFDAIARQGQGLPSPLALWSIIFWMSLQFQNKLGPSWTNTIQWKRKVPRRGKVCLPPGFLSIIFWMASTKKERRMKGAWKWISWHNEFLYTILPQ